MSKVEDITTLPKSFSLRKKIIIGAAVGLVAAVAVIVVKNQSESTDAE